MPEGPKESGGQRMRRRLKTALSTRPSLLLLDEPTNHLDERHRAWLAAEVAAFPGTVVIACHDRAFIDAVCTRVLHLERGSLQSYPGGYSDFERARAAAGAAATARFDDWRRQDEHLRQAADRQRRWAEKAHAQASERDPFRKKRASQLMNKALATEGRLQRHQEERPEKPWQAPEFRFRLVGGQRIPRRLVQVEALTFRYHGSTRDAFAALTFQVGNGERVCLEGPNGSGKTTVLHLVAQTAGVAASLPGVRGGALRVAQAARCLFVRQDEAVVLDSSALSQMLEQGVQDAAHARTLLGAFHLRGPATLRPARELSPGERVRLAFCLALVAQPDLLLLDEPTNHLELEGRVALEAALQRYPGAVLLSSHDSVFRERVATQRLQLGAAAAVKTDELGTERLRLQMRMAELEGRIAAARPVEKPAIEAEIRQIAKFLRRS